MKDIFEKCIGKTPLEYLPVLSAQLETNIYAKFEYFNLGMSSKDRPACYMIHKAIEEGNLSEGGTIVEATSGNTGLGVALIAKRMGFQCHLFVSDKISREKEAILATQGAEVTVCPSSVSSEDPQSTYKRAAAFAEAHKNAYFLNQYYNPGNVAAHYETTGPEIYEDLDGNINRFIAGAGTCGTITGVGTFLKDQSEEIEVIAVDALGSVLTNYFKTGKLNMDVKKKYTVEGIGKGFIPGILDCNPIDRFIQISDEESITFAQEFSRLEGHLVGYSSGAVIAAAHHLQGSFAPDDTTVLFFPDHGSRYLSKIYNEEWTTTNFERGKTDALIYG